MTTNNDAGKPGRVRWYYYCAGHGRKGKSKCAPCNIPQEIIEDFVIGEVEKRIQEILAADGEERLLERVNKHLDAPARNVKEEIRSLETRVREIQLKVRRCMELGDILVVKEEVGRLNQERLQVENLLTEARTHNLQAVDPRHIVQRIRDLAAKARDVLKQGTPVQRKRVLRAFIFRIDIDPLARTGILRLRTLPEESGETVVSRHNGNPLPSRNDSGITVDSRQSGSPHHSRNDSFDNCISVPFNFGDWTRKSLRQNEIRQILEIVAKPPESLGLGATRWTTRLLAEQVISRGIVTSISLPTLRYQLAKSGIALYEPISRDPENVHKIRELVEQGIPSREVAKRFGVSKTYIKLLAGATGPCVPLTSDQIEQILALARATPQSGDEGERWSLTRIRNEAIRRGIVEGLNIGVLSSLLAKHNIRHRSYTHVSKDPAKVQLIRDRHREGVSQSAIARQLGISLETVNAIVRGRRASLRGQGIQADRCANTALAPQPEGPLSENA